MYEGVFYHIYNRGNNSERIFFEKENYHYFLRRYKKYLSPHIDTYAYCLMPTHFHFCIRVKEETQTTKVSESFVVPPSPEKPPKLTPLEKAFRDFFISYAKSINKRYDRTGSLFQYKFKRKPVLNENYLTQLILYLHTNPLKAGLCQKYNEWEFSSYNAILSNTPSSIERNDILHLFDGRENFIALHQEYANEHIFHEDDKEFNQLVRW